MKRLPAKTQRDTLPTPTTLSVQQRHAVDSNNPKHSAQVYKLVLNFILEFARNEFCPCASEDVHMHSIQILDHFAKFSRIIYRKKDAFFIRILNDTN